jgi:hypothetical protein
MAMEPSLSCHTFFLMAIRPLRHGEPIAMARVFFCRGAGVPSRGWSTGLVTDARNSCRGAAVTASWTGSLATMERSRPRPGGEAVDLCPGLGRLGLGERIGDAGSLESIK